MATVTKNTTPRPTRSVPGAAALGGLLSSARAMTVVVVALSLVVVGGLLLGGAYGARLYQQHREASARTAAMAAAKTTCVNLMSVSATTVDRDIKRTLAGATGDFASQYKAGEPRLKQATQENKVTAKGSVLYAAVTTMKIDKSATVLLAMDAVVKNTNSPDGRKAHYRVRATMAYQHGRWLVSAVEFVG
jgi:Mce-associated membrane protein